MTKRPSVAIVGAGRLGSTLLRELPSAGYRIIEVVARDRKESLRRLPELSGPRKRNVSTYETAKLEADLIWFCVPDAEIANAARMLASRTNWEGKKAFHSSGALGSAELRILRRKGAKVASVHPFMSFVHASKPSLGGVPFGIEGDAAAIVLARRVVKDLGGMAFLVPKAGKIAYHAWGSFASPLLVALLTTAEEVADLSGVSRELARKRMMPIILQTLANYEKLGPARAFSGPIVRGDAATVRAHINVLRKKPDAKEAYIALAKAAIRFLPARNKEQLKKAIRG